MNLVICKLPKAGLGNQLFPLFKALVFAEKHGLKIIIIGYHQGNWKYYLKRTKVKRQYVGYFKFQKKIIGEYIDRFKSYFYLKKYLVISNPDINKNILKDNTVYVFSGVPHWNDYFLDLKENRDQVINLMNQILKPKILKIFDNSDYPIIGVHIRMGDFRKLKNGEDFKKVGAVRTPETYFIDIINKIRQVNGTDLPVSVFTDGYSNEFEELFKLNNIKIVEGNPDIIDILLLSKSKLIVTSAGSTFSCWSSFLSDAPVIMHPDHIHKPLRPENVNKNSYEGALLPNDINLLLEKNIKNIKN